MVRAKGMFLASRFYDAERDTLKPSPLGTPQLLCEQEISEDIELGSRMHACGWKSVFVKQNLATGEVRAAAPACTPLLQRAAESFAKAHPQQRPAVHAQAGVCTAPHPPCVRARGSGRPALQVPLAPRDMWRQRLRWFKGGHLFVLNRHSIFFRRQRHVTVPQRLAYCIGLIAHGTQLWATPVIFTMPLTCIVFEVCAFGIDRWLFYTHMARVVGSTLLSAHATTRRHGLSGLAAVTGARVQWFTGVKAVLNTCMVLAGWKRPPAFKLTPKMLANGDVGELPETSVPLGVVPAAGEASPSKAGKAPDSEGSSDGDASSKPKSPRVDLTKVRAGLARPSQAIGPLTLLMHRWLQAHAGTACACCSGDAAARRLCHMHQQYASRPTSAMSQIVTTLPHAHCSKPRAAMQVHRSLSKVTETRRLCMPMGGTLDVWVLVAILFINLVAIAVGLRFLARRDALLEWGERQESVVWIGVIWAAVEVCPSALFLGYAARAVAATLHAQHQRRRQKPARVQVHPRLELQPRAAEGVGAAGGHAVRSAGRARRGPCLHRPDLGYLTGFWLVSALSVGVWASRDASCIASAYPGRALYSLHLEMGIFCGAQPCVVALCGRGWSRSVGGRQGCRAVARMTQLVCGLWPSACYIRTGATFGTPAHDVASWRLRRCLIDNARAGLGAHSGVERRCTRCASGSHRGSG